MEKASVDEIRKRFDNDVERFSNLETGQVSTVDAQISLELITESAKRIKPDAKTLLDIGCGAGNYTIKMLGKIPNLKCTLVDLSKPMLDKACERIAKVNANKIHILQSDIRVAKLGNECFDIVLAGAVLHHLRDDSEWLCVFKKIYESLTYGGCLMISDLVLQENEALAKYSWQCYKDYLEKIGGVKYSQKVLDYIEKEDSPRSINYQMDLMKKVGFKSIDILHKNICFCAFGAIK
jgi:tRNA (cmo5U34)-methyltransferase